MKDLNGEDIDINDIVNVPCRVKAIHEDGTLFLRTIYPIGAYTSNTEVLVKAKQVVKVKGPSNG